MNCLSQKNMIKYFCDRSWEDMFAEGRIPYAITQIEDGEWDIMHCVI